MSREYRIVRDNYNGFEVQSRCWWWPLWTQGESNSHSTIEGAEAYAMKCAKPKPPRVVKMLGRLPHQPAAQQEDKS